MGQDLGLISLIINRMLSSHVCCMEMAVNFDFIFSENYGYV